MIQIPKSALARVRGAALACAAFAMLAGCADKTQLYDTWKDPDAESASLSKILVIAAKRTPTSRRIWEDTFSARLAENGTKAVASYRYFSDALPDTQQVIDLVLKEAFDGVLVVNRAQVDTVVEQHAGTVTTVPVTVRDTWNGFYRTMYRDVYQPGYVEEVTVVTQEINLWGTGSTGGLVWSGTAQTYDAETREQTCRDVVDEVVDELESRNLLVAR
ncbi:MAG: hypothetical protein ACKVU1_13930 [bacterium]